MTLDEIWKRVQVSGPSHLLLDKEGNIQMTVIQLAKTPDMLWDMVYIRNDGFSLGCDIYLAHYAENLFRNDWIGLVKRGDKKPRPVNFAVDNIATTSA